MDQITSLLAAVPHTSFQTTAIIAGVAVPMFLALLFLRRGAAKHAARLKAGRFSSPAAYLETAAKSTSIYFLLLVSVGAGLAVSGLPRKAEDALRLLVAAGVILQVGIWGDALIKQKISRTVSARRETDPASVTAFGIIDFLVRLVFWTAVILVALENFGFDVTTLVAGLGVGSIALALSVQKLLGDVLSSISIVLDKPFEAGDLIAIGPLTGTVEQIGIRSTRLRAPSGEQVVVPNTDLLAGRIQNFSRMTNRRLTIELAVSRSPGVDQLEAVPALLRRIIDPIEKAHFEKAHLKQIAENAFIFDLSVQLSSPEALVFSEVQSTLLFKIARTFENEGISLIHS